MSTVAPRCPGPHSTGFFVVPDESLRILNFFAPKPDLPSRIIRCPGQILSDFDHPGQWGATVVTPYI
ncbi:hypothetical protein L873DRAFT_1809378 [Choiromyces venosus 120613-1]|uniref:Uncharacterized protein n=1 Tax=Choiromyces venosus 120613-1 TaxID=1336337 RepID=A0A3N4JHB7_9PEZI|nr:hypothetical protein L873DRAFT_1809378 [Choiromyces venosus 120613-1]